jgi:ion channel-forming bestrophin family protein
MISYNPKDWAGFIFRFHKSDTFRKLLPLLVAIGAYAGGIAWLELDVLKLSQRSYVKNVSLIHTLLGFAISMLLVFRTNTAYDRWWEGRRQWGALVNNSRNLALKLHAFLPLDATAHRSFFRHIIPRFATELRLLLQREETRYQLDEQPHPEIPHFDGAKHAPMQVVLLMQQKLNSLRHEGLLSLEHVLLLNNDITSFMDICGACERIKNTPIPYSYSAFLKKFIFIYVVTLPIGYVFSLGYIVVPITILLLYVLGSLELIAEEIEDPFGKDTNDLPMERMSENIDKNIAELLA